MLLPFTAKANNRCTQHIPFARFALYIRKKKAAAAMSKEDDDGNSLSGISIEEFKYKYDLLRRALDHSRTNEDDLIQQVKVLKDELVEANVNLKLALETAAEYKKTIKELTYKNARSLRAEARSRQSEIAAQRLISKLRGQVTMLADQVRQVADAAGENSGARSEGERQIVDEAVSALPRRRVRSAKRAVSARDTSSFEYWKQKRNVWTPSKKKLYSKPPAKSRPSTAHTAHKASKGDAIHAHEASLLTRENAEKRRDLDSSILCSVDAEKWGDWGSLLPIESLLISQGRAFRSRPNTTGNLPRRRDYVPSRTPLERASARIPKPLSASVRKGQRSNSMIT